MKTKEMKYINKDGFELIKELHVLDVKTNHRTHLVFKNMELNSGIKDSEFHEMKLKQIP